MALLYSEQRFYGRQFIWSLGTVCFSLPALLGALGLVSFWGRSGWVNLFLKKEFGIEFDFYGWAAILLAHVFFNFPLAMKVIGNALLSQSREEEKAALSLGARRIYCFYRITLPKIFPAIQRAFVLSFLYCAGSFILVLMLGGGPKFSTLEVAIYRATRLDFDLAVAARLATIQIGVCLLTYALFLRETPRLAALSENTLPLYFPRSKSIRTLLLAFCAVGFFFLVGGPLLTLFASGVSHLAELDVPLLLMSLKNSFILALITTVFSLFLALSLCYGSRHAKSKGLANIFHFAAGAPLSISTILITLALTYTYTSLLQILRGSMVAVSLIQSLIFLPIVYSTLRDGWNNVEDPLLRAASSLGSNAFQTFVYVELPLLKSSVVVAALFAASLSLGEVGTLLMLNANELVTLPLWIFRLMGQHHFEGAFAAGVILLSFVLLLEGLVGLWIRLQKK